MGRVGKRDAELEKLAKTQFLGYTHPLSTKIGSYSQSWKNLIKFRFFSEIMIFPTLVKFASSQCSQRVGR